MTAYIIFGPNNKVLKVADCLLSRLGYGALDEAPGDWDALFVEDAHAFEPSEMEPRTRFGYLKRKNGQIEEVETRVQYFDERREMRLVEVEFLGEAGDGTEEGQTIDPAGLSFLTTVSHELRVSLNGVIGFANLLSNSVTNPAQREIISKLQSCNFVLKGLINDILEYSRVVSTSLDMKAETVRFGEFVREIAGLFAERARRKGLEFNILIDPSADLEVDIPKLRVTQVMSNLISNAIKFTETGWVKVSASGQGPRLLIDVRDSGPGVQEADEWKLFRPFAQTNLQGKAKEGIGLGLAISKSLVERMGGDLRYERPSEGGSCFQFSLPFAKRDEARGRGGASVAAIQSPPEELDSKRSRSAGKRGAPRHVLIVEDNQLNADILSHFLRDYGATYDVVSNGREAVDRYEDGKYDLVLMDVMLPEMNGYEATERILARSERESALPIVGVTAKVFRRDQMRCLESGMVEVIHKPVDFKALRNVLDRYLYGIQREGDGETMNGNVPERLAVVDFAGERDSSAGSPLNRSVFEEYIQRMVTEDATRRDIVDTAVGIVDAEVTKLLNALASESVASIGMRAHSLKGALAILGAQNALDIAKGLEVVASKEDAQVRREHWSALIKGSYEEFKQGLEDYMKQADQV